MKAILLIDHGSQRDAANEMMNCMANLVQTMAGPEVVVRYAHMELAEPSIAAGVGSASRRARRSSSSFPTCSRRASTPRATSRAWSPKRRSRFPQLAVQVTSAFGVHEKLAEVILARAGLPVVLPLTSEEAARCWHSTRSGVACGDACRCHPESEAVATSADVKPHSR